LPLRTAEYNDDKDEYLENIVNLIKEAAQRIKLFTDKVSVSMTGGLDTRLQLAALLSVGIKPILIHGQGFISTHNKDLEICKLIAERFRLPLKIRNWNFMGKINKDWETILRDYGEYYYINNGTSAFFKGFESEKEAEMILYGYYGEPFRNIEWLEELKNNTFTSEEYIDFYIGNKVENICSDYDQYHKYISNKINNIIIKEGYEFNNIDKSNYEKIAIWIRKHGSSALHNFTNDFCYCYTYLADSNLMSRILNIPYEYKYDDNFMLKVIQSLYPDMLNIPFFTHRVFKVFDYKKFRLENKMIGVRKLQNIILNKISRDSIFYRIANICYQLLIAGNANAINTEKAYNNKDLIYDILKNSPMKLDIIDASKIEKIEYERARLFALYIYMVNDVFKI